MSFSDEILMAYADGELAEPARTEVECAMRADPAIAARVAQHKALRGDVFAAFAGVLNEPVPPRLQPVGGASNVIQLDSVRAARQPVRERRQWSWPQWGAMAASLAVGVLAGTVAMNGRQSDSELASVAGKGGALVAQGKLAGALSQQLASAAPADGDVRIGVSFMARDGKYCRSFKTAAAAGLACRSGEEWRIPVLAESEPGATYAYRQAASATPPAVLDAIDQRIAGATLDAGAERAALQRGWQR